MRRNRESVDVAYAGPGDDPLRASAFMIDVLDQFKSARVTAEDARQIVQTEGTVVSAWGLVDEVRRKAVSLAHLKRMTWFCPVFPLCERHLHPHAFESDSFAYPWFQHNQLRLGESPCPGFTRSGIDSVHMEAAKDLYIRLMRSKGGVIGHSICAAARCLAHFDLFRVDGPYYIKEEKNWLYTGEDQIVEKIRPDLTVYRDESLTQELIAFEIYHTSLSKPYKLDEFKRRGVHCIEVEARSINRGRGMQSDPDGYLHLDAKVLGFDYFGAQTGYRRKYCADCTVRRKIEANRKRQDRAKARDEALKCLEDGRRWAMKARQQVALVFACAPPDLSEVEAIQPVLELLNGYLSEACEAALQARRNFSRALEISPNWLKRPVDQQCSKTREVVVLDDDGQSLPYSVRLLANEIDAAEEEIGRAREVIRRLQDADRQLKQEQERRDREIRLRELQERQQRELEESLRIKKEIEEKARIEQEIQEQRRAQLEAEERRQSANRVRSAHSATKRRYALCGGAQRARFDETWMPLRHRAAASQTHDDLYFEVFQSENGWRWKIENNGSIVHASECDHASEDEAKQSVGEFWFSRGN